MLDFREILVSQAPPDFLDQATDVINRANAARVRIFSGLRLEENMLALEYPNSLLVIGSEAGVAIATMACETSGVALKVELVAVVPEAKGRLIAAKILERADQIAAQRELTSLLIEVVDIGGLIAYYEKLGFVEDSRVTKPQGYWDSSMPFDLVTMSRPM